MTSNTQGIEFLRNPSVNKATAYTETEKQSLGLVGLVPDVTETIDTQLSRVLWQLQQKTSDLERYIYLMNLLDINETLFYHTLMSDPGRFLEIVYDPTIGEACLKFDHILRRPRGMSVANSCLCRDWGVKESTTMATPTIRFQGRADVDLRRFLRCFAGETSVTSMQIVIVPELR